MGKLRILLIEGDGVDEATMRQAFALLEEAATGDKEEAPPEPIEPHPCPGRVEPAGESDAAPLPVGPPHPPSVAPILCRQPAPPPGTVIRRRRIHRGSVAIEIRGQADNPYSPAEAARVTGVHQTTIKRKILAAGAGEWVEIGGVHLRRAAGGAESLGSVAAAAPAAGDGLAAAKEKLQAKVDAIVYATPPIDPVAEWESGKGAPATDPHAARPRERGNLAPINPNIVGAAAPITHAEVRPRGPARLIKSGEDHDR